MGRDKNRVGDMIGWAFAETMLFEKHVEPATTQPLRLKNRNSQNYTMITRLDDK